MSGSDEDNLTRQPSEEEIDFAIENTFPASDPPALAIDDGQEQRKDTGQSAEGPGGADVTRSIQSRNVAYPSIGH